MMSSRVLKSVIFGILFLVHSALATYKVASFGTQVKPKPKLSVQAYNRHKTPHKLLQRQKQLKIKHCQQIRLKTDNKQELYTVLQQCNQVLVQAQMRYNAVQEQLYLKRIQALKKTIENNGAIKYYQNEKTLQFIAHSNNMNVSLVGTDVDECLHKELCATQQQALKMLNADSKNIHAQHLVPLIIDTTIQAKQEQDIAVAFVNADVAAQLIRIIECTSKKFCAVGRGVEKSLHNVTSVEHWKQMALGLKNVATAVVTSAAEQELLDDALYCYDKNVSKELLQLYEYKTEKQKQELHQHFVGTYKKMREMSKSELLEAGTEFATTLLLDTVMLNTASWATTAAGRATIETIESALYGGVAEQYTAELMDLSRVVVTKDEHALIKLFCEFDQDVALVKEVGFLPSDYLRKEIDLAHPSTPVNRIGMKKPFEVMKGIRKPTKINGRIYSDHAFENMQKRGFTPTTIEAIIKNGKKSQDTIKKNRWNFYDKTNNITVVTEKSDGTVVTAFMGENPSIE